MISRNFDTGWRPSMNSPWYESFSLIKRKIASEMINTLAINRMHFKVHRNTELKAFVNGQRKLKFRFIQKFVIIC